MTLIVHYDDQAEALKELQRRGYDPQAHHEAIVAGDDDAITLTHPFNWLTEEEVEADPWARNWYRSHIEERTA